MFICISAEYYTNNKLQNETAINNLSKDLKSFQFKFSPIKGKYKGVTEKSFIVKVNTQKDLDILTSLGNKYNQETVLFVHEDNKSYLIKCSNASLTMLGKFVNVEKKEAISQDAYSIIGNKYFIVK